MIATKSVWSSNEEHDIHNIKWLLFSLLLAHATSILQIDLDGVGKGDLQRSIQVGLSCIQENVIYDIFLHAMWRFYDTMFENGLCPQNEDIA